MQRNILLFFLLFGASLQSPAQVPVIVKDYNNCTYGLQNSSGTWVAQPIYSTIRLFNAGYAIAIRDGKYCLLNKSGKEVIPAQNNHITTITSYSGLYLSSTSGDSSYVLDTIGRKLISVPYQISGWFYDSSSASVDRDKHVHFVHLNGQVFDAPTYVNAYPQFLGSKYYAFTQDTIIGVRKNGDPIVGQFRGVIDSRAQIIVPAKFNNVKLLNGAHQIIQTEKSPLTGYYSLDGKELWKCEYLNVETPSGYDLSNGDCYAQHKNTWGVIRWNGDTVVPFQFHSRPQLLNYDRYIVQDSLHYGLYCSDSGFVLPLKYDCIRYFQPNSAHYNSYINCSYQGMWGCYDVFGDEYVAPKYDTIFDVAKGTIFYSPKDVVLIEILWRNTVIGISESTYRKWNIIANNYYNYGDFVPDYRNDTILSFNYNWEESYKNAYPNSDPKRDGKNPYPVIYHQPSEPTLVYKRLFTVHNNPTGYTSYYNVPEEGLHSYLLGDMGESQIEVLLITYEDSLERTYYFGRDSDPILEGYWKISNGREEGVITWLGRVVIPPGKYDWFGHVGNHFCARTPANQISVIDTSGNFICTTPGIYMDAFHGDTVWVALRELDYVPPNRSRENIRLKYVLFDMQRKQYLLDTSIHIIYPFYNLGYPVKYRTSKGIGFIDPITLQTVVSPVYNFAEELDERRSSYYVSDCNGKIGIIDSNNHVIVPLMYEEIIQITGMAYEQAPNTREYLPGEDSQFLLYNQSGAGILFSTSQGTKRLDSIGMHELIYSIILQSASNRSYNNYPGQKIHHECYDCPMQLDNRGHVFSHWQLNYLYRVMFLGGQSHYSLHSDGGCNCCAPDASVNRYKPDSYTNPLAFSALVIRGKSDSMLTFTSTKTSYYRSSTYHNIFLFRKGPRPIKLDTLFTGTQWEQIVTDAVINYANNHKEINADCSKPGTIPKTLNDRFLIVEGGINLYPNWSYKMNGQRLDSTPEIFVPWTTLRPHLKPEMERKIFDQ